MKEKLKQILALLEDYVSKEGWEIREGIMRQVRSIAATMEPMLKGVNLETLDYSITAPIRRDGVVFKDELDEEGKDLLRNINSLGEKIAALTAGFHFGGFSDGEDCVVLEDSNASRYWINTNDADTKMLLEALADEIFEDLDDFTDALYDWLEADDNDEITEYRDAMFEMADKARDSAKASNKPKGYGASLIDGIIEGVETMEGFYLDILKFDDDTSEESKSINRKMDELQEELRASWHSLKNIRNSGLSEEALQLACDGIDSFNGNTSLFRGAVERPIDIVESVNTALEADIVI